MTAEQSSNTPRLLRLAAEDNVAVATAAAERGAILPLAGADAIVVADPIAVGHKVAIRDIAQGEKILKFGCPIGSATRAIRCGEHVHTHNLKSDYLPTFTLDSDRKFVKD
jgi:altronate dehydratase small subunit